MRKWLVPAALVIFALLLVSVSCSKAPAPAPDKQDTAPAPGGAPGPTMYPPVTVTATATARPYPTLTPMPTPIPAPAPPGVSDAGLAYDAERMIVRTGDMAVVVQDIPAAIERITRLAETAKGYVVSSRTWRDGDSLHGNITIRVPAGD
ncbi:MAG: DUF4349 domain-containing protein, partial [Chloroflexi bacterium]|nr:DUF4349 domain-containing protein [Chloroflexota bacterium]